MKKLLAIVLILAVLVFSSCSKIEEADTKEVVDQLFEYIEKGDYTSASALFCADEDNGKSFSEFLDEVETETGLDFQSDIEILEYSEYHSAPDSYFGVVCATLNIRATVDGKEMTMRIDVLENKDAIECFHLVIYTENNTYEFLCHDID